MVFIFFGKCFFLSGKIKNGKYTILKNLGRLKKKKNPKRSGLIKNIFWLKILHIYLHECSSTSLKNDNLI